MEGEGGCAERGAGELLSRTGRQKGKGQLETRLWPFSPRTRPCRYGSAGRLVTWPMPAGTPPCSPPRPCPPTRGCCPR